MRVPAAPLLQALLLALACALPATALAQGVELSGELRTQSPVTARFDVGDYQLPMGAYASVNVEFIERPDGEKPTVRPGFPDTVLTFHERGRYIIDFHLSQVSKSSCGGAEARTLVRSRETVTVE